MWKLQLRRLMYARRVQGSELQKCWQMPLPSIGRDWRQVSFLVVDAEMSSLNVNEGELLSVGWVCVEDGAIALNTARHYLIKATNSVGQSATIHKGEGLPSCVCAGKWMVPANTWSESSR